MKVTVNVDCTPDEARSFMGLPDLTPLHDAYVDRLRIAIDQGLSPDAISAMMQAWGPMGETGLSMWKTLFSQMKGFGSVA